MKKYKEFLKSIIIVMGTQAFFYFLLKTFIGDFHVMNSILKVPFIKYFVYFYDIWYPFVLLTAFIIYKHDKEVYYKLVFTMIIGAFLSHITFLIYPTTVIRPEISVHSLTDFILYVTYKTDTPAVNCLPSVHCLFCFILSYYTLKCKNLNIKYKLLITTVFMLIVLSTFFIYQHVIEDAILALIYAIITILIVSKLINTLKKVLKFIF